jgi:hypothetical protein
LQADDLIAAEVLHLLADKLELRNGFFAVGGYVDVHLSVRDYWHLSDVRQGCGYAVGDVLGKTTQHDLLDRLIENGLFLDPRFLDEHVHRDHPAACLFARAFPARTKAERRPCSR